MVFFKGHRIRLEVSSSNFPRFDHNPNTEKRIASEAKVIAAKQTVRHGVPFPSRLILQNNPVKLGHTSRKRNVTNPKDGLGLRRLASIGAQLARIGC